MNDLLENQQPDAWHIEHAGAFYEIKYDSERGANYPHPPRWYVQRMNDMRTSERYYSRASGAFMALASGAVSWI